MTVDTIGKANAVPDRIDVLRTTRRSISVNHAVAVAAHVGGAATGWAPSPRSGLDPVAEVVAAWALGDPGDWTVTITTDDGGQDTHSLAEAGVAAIDVVVDSDAR